MSTTTITPEIRFAAHAVAAELEYSGPFNDRMLIGVAGQVESFPASYSHEYVAAAEALLAAVAAGDWSAEVEAFRPMVADTHELGIRSRYYG